MPTETETTEATLEAAAPSGSVIRDKSNVIARALVKTHGMQAGQIVTGPFIDLITSLLGTLLPMLLKCLPAAATPTDVHAAMTKLTWIQHLFINREVRKSLGTIRAYREMGQAMHDEIVKAATAATVEDTSAAMEESASL